MAKKQPTMAKKQPTKKKATKKKATKKKATKKKAMKKKTANGGLTGEQSKKVRRLLNSKDAANVNVAIQLLKSTEATGDDWRDVFSSRTISVMVNTWDLAVWKPVLADLAGHPRLQSEFHNVAADRFQKLSGSRADTFIQDGFKKMEKAPQLVTLVLNLATLDRDGLRVGLSCLTTLSDSVAEVLSKIKGDLDLYGLTSLSDAAAESLSKFNGKLYLGGLKSLSDAAAESLSKHKGGLDLGGLKSLSDAAAESLSKHKGDLSLYGLKSLSDAAAESLSKHKGDLGLGGLKSLSDAAAESLSKHKGDLDLSGLKSLSDSHGHVALAESLSKINDRLNLYGLKSLSDAAAESLSKHKGYLGLGGLKSLSDAAAESLSKHKGDLNLGGLKSLSDAAAESLSKHKGGLGLSGLKSLSDAATESLSLRYGEPILGQSRGSVWSKVNKFIRRRLAAQRKQEKTSEKKGRHILSKEQLRKVHTLVKSKDSANVEMAIQLLQSAEASSADWSDVFSSRTISLMVNTWDLAVWDTVLTGFVDHPPLQAEFLKLVTGRFPRLSSDRGNDFIQAAMKAAGFDNGKNDFQEVTQQQVLIITTLADCNTHWGRDYLVSFLLKQLVRSLDLMKA